MKLLPTLCMSALMVGLANSTLLVSSVILGSYGEESLVDAIAVSGKLQIGKKARLPQGYIEFRCTALEFEAKARLPEAPEQIPCEFINGSSKPIPDYILSDVDNPSLTLTLESSMLEIDDEQQLSKPVSLSFTYQGYKFNRPLAPEKFAVILKPDLFESYVSHTILFTESLYVESSA